MLRIMIAWSYNDITYLNFLAKYNIGLKKGW